MSLLPIVYGNVDQNGNIQVSSDNFTVSRLKKGIYQITYDQGLSFEYPPCVLVTGSSHNTNEESRAGTLQANNKDGFQVSFKSTGGNLNDCGFNLAVFYANS